ncbi:hypothetical protein ABZX30_27525 [Streptomyces sp. NPDC004542]|uniref:hypothetical protein n=1 Tax=Streptomyces sp. NPDC004542 TaxID=3154281 RepID=UPI0033A79082
MELQIAPDTINNTRLELKRVGERGTLEAERGLFTRPPQQGARRRRYPARSSPTKQSIGH